ncbi:MAG: hypothetical protein KF678_11095 [Phycisphaeraceae bacterium]|nr:hypothetical protein [Phycisphaeraceae bacterium]
MDLVTQWMIALALLTSATAAWGNMLAVRRTTSRVNALIAKMMEPPPAPPFDTVVPYDAATQARIIEMLNDPSPAEANARATEFEANKYGASRLGPEAVEIAGRVGPGGGGRAA